MENKNPKHRNGVALKDKWRNMLKKGLTEEQTQRLEDAKAEDTDDNTLPEHAVEDEDGNSSTDEDKQN